MKKKIALLGCGIWGQNILKELVSLNAETTVYEANSDLKQKTLDLGATGFHIGLPYPEHYDGIIIATPSTTHRSLIEILAPSGIPIFLEKPLTTTLEDAIALENLSPDNVFLMHVWLYHSGIKLLREIVRSGELGRILGIRSTRVNWTSPRKDTDSAWNLSPHDITIAKAILGYLPAPRSAVAERHNGIIRGFIAMLGDDPFVVFEVSNRYEHKIREVRVHFEKGIAVLEDEKTDHIKVIHGDASSDLKDVRIENRNFDSTPPLHLEISEFLHYLEGGPPPQSSFSDGLEVIKMIRKLVELTL
jgi:predicted dehydrogenase